MSKGNGHDPDSSMDLLDVQTLKGDGSVEMVVFQDDEQIIMRFRKAMEWVGFDPPNAVAVGKQLIDLAVMSGANVELVLPRPQVTPQQRERMMNRTAHIFRSMSEKGRPPDFIAQQIVDTILSELG